ncbi:MAG: Spi family protease inhibitor, partial [Rikenellaceae bacterium]|nr:Spi family protease inhibitor [Rikenellaceae bacterium]
MKRLLLLLVVCCTAFACEQNDAVQPQNTTKQATKSKYRTLDDAIDIAEKSVSMLGEQTRATKRSIDRSRIRAVLDRRATTRSAAADTLIYIINFDDSAGFALVPRSTSKPELLAITEKGNYDGEETDNEGFNIYMDRAFEWIVDSTHDGQPVDTTFNPGVGGGGIGDQVITEWKSTSEYDSTKVSPKISVSWGQDVPYNYMCFYQGYFGGMPAKA